MKKLIFIGGPMGIGKTTVSENLLQQLDNAVFLDGDWCWQMHPWRFTEENKQMVLKNIQTLLQSYLDNSTFEHIIFCWVMDEQKIIEDILAGLILRDTSFYSLSLVAEPEKLIANIQKDIAKERRSEAAIPAALARLEKYPAVNSQKIETTALTVAETVATIKQHIF